MRDSVAPAGRLRPLVVGGKFVYFFETCRGSEKTKKFSFFFFCTEEKQNKLRKFALLWGE